MSVRKKFRAIMSGKKLVLMPGCYDALSARVIEAEGFEAIVAYVGEHVRSVEGGEWLIHRDQKSGVYQPFVQTAKRKRAIFKEVFDALSDDETPAGSP